MLRSARGSVPRDGVGVRRARQRRSATALSAFAGSLPAVGQSGKAGRRCCRTSAWCASGKARWDEALSYYERGRDESLKIGSTINAGVARINIAEILIDRGELAEAEELLLETLPLWKASRYRYFLGACLSLLGRASLRAGRLDEALKRLEEAKSEFSCRSGRRTKCPPSMLELQSAAFAWAISTARLGARGRLAQPRRLIERCGEGGAPVANASVLTRCCGGATFPALGRNWKQASRQPGRGRICSRLRSRCFR